jgi:deoxyribodipyrimidine photo-lyase
LPIRDISELPDVFTTYRKSLGPLNMRPRPPHPKPALLPPLPTGAAAPPHATFREPDTLSSLLSALLAPLPTSTMGLANPPRWPPDLLGLAEHSAPERALGGGEAAAAARLHAILARGIVSGYAATRNGLLGDGFSTRLSGYLALGCVTARRVHAQMALFEAGLVDGAGAAGAEPSLAHPWRAAPGFGAGEGAGGAAVRCELLWRDYMRLCARKSGARLFALEGPRGAVAGPQQRWRRVDDGPGGGESDGTASSGSSGGKAAGRGLSPGAAATAPAAEVLHRYLEGRTGAGLIDASQRELFLTGHTSSRARQNAASFLAKHMRLDWRVGAEWYECMLVDYDAASCWANWAYAAGVGNDPREERIFNPVKQALEYDPRGAFVTAWVPELRGAVNLDDEDGPEAMMGVFQPWRLDDAVKERLGLSGVDWVERPLVRIEFSVGKKPRSRNGKQRYYRFRARKGHRDDGDRGAAERAGA